MADDLTPEQRRRCMVAIRSKDTKPEIIVRRLVHRLGFRFRLHRRDLPGRPDLVLPRHRKVILAVVRHAEEKLFHGAMLPWVHRRDCRGEGRHAVLGTTHELYLLLAEANDNLYLDEQPRLWHLQGPRAFSRGVVQVSRQCASRLHVSVDRLHIKDNLARTRFGEFVAAARCHPAIWNVSVRVGPEAGLAEREALVEEGFVDDAFGTDDDEVKQWNLDLRE